jgi:cysteine dioxygenase
MLISELGIKINNLLVNDTLFTDDKIKEIINSYNGDDWKNYVNSNETQYNKIKVFENDIFDIYVIVWNVDQQSKIHNHSSNGCWLKILEGKVEERIYNEKFDLTKYIVQNQGEISFIKDDIGYHSVKNINNNISVSLHVYNPPNFKITNFL